MGSRQNIIEEPYRKRDSAKNRDNQIYCWVTSYYTLVIEVTRDIQKEPDDSESEVLQASVLAGYTRGGSQVREARER